MDWNNFGKTQNVERVAILTSEERNLPANIIPARINLAFAFVVNTLEYTKPRVNITHDGDGLDRYSEKVRVSRAELHPAHNRAYKTALRALERYFDDDLPVDDGMEELGNE